MAETPASVCPQGAEPLPAALTEWAVEAPLAARRDPDTPLAQVGHGYTLTPSAGLNARSPKPAAVPGSFSGISRFSVATAGMYQVAIGAAAWVDVVDESGVLSSIGHAHAPACSVSARSSMSR